MQEHKTEKIIVYSLTCAAVDFYALAIPILAGKDGLQTSALHGKMKQSQREATLAAFAAKPGGALSLCLRGSLSGDRASEDVHRPAPAQLRAYGLQEGAFRVCCMLRVCPNLEPTSSAS